MKILLGPSSSGKCHVALLHYEYAPGETGREALASKVTVTDQFWFDP